MKKLNPTSQPKYSRILALSATALGLAIATPSNAALVTGLELYYDFENDTLAAGGITDQSGNNRHGSAVSVIDATLGFTFSTNVPTAIGSGLSLQADGTDEILANMPGYNGVTGGANRTISAWVQVAAAEIGTNRNMHILEWGIDSVANGQRWTVRRHQQTGSARLEIDGDFRIANGMDISDGNWHHVAMVFDNQGDSLLEEVTIYVDGTAAGTYTDGGAADIIDTDATTTVRVGGSLNTNAREWNGRLDEIGIWSRALSPTEVDQLANGATIPEPATSAFLLLGAIGFLTMRRNR